jgi:hypothetical protein
MGATQNPSSDAEKSGKDDIQGEGNYDAARRYDAEQRSFAHSGKVEQKAREAADSLDGAGADDIEAARKTAAEGDPLKTSGKSGSKAKAGANKPDPHMEDSLDSGLEESFPASDPVSVHKVD